LFCLDLLFNGCCGGRKIKKLIGFVCLVLHLVNWESCAFIFFCLLYSHYQFSIGGNLRYLVTKEWPCSQTEVRVRVSVCLLGSFL